MRIRRGTESDLDALVDVNRASAVTAYASIFGSDPFPTERVRARYRRLLSDPACVVFLAEDGEQTLGFIAAQPHHLAALYVSPSAWGRGAGSRLYDVAMPLLGWDATLWVLEANARGRCFWERRGWEPDGERRIEHGKVELRYRWRPRTGSAEGIT